MDLETILTIVFVVAFIGVIAFTVRRHLAIKRNGIEVDATVSHIDEDITSDSDGGTDVNYTVYVTYRTAEGQYVEAKLGNGTGDLVVGSTIRVKYLPEKPKYVIQVRG